MKLNVSGAAHETKVRIGPISVITLIAVISIAVLAVLAISTAHASLTIAERQAASTTEMYANEDAAQVFMAGLDEALSGNASKAASARSSATNAAGPSGASGSLQSALPGIAQEVETATDGAVKATANLEGNVVTAEFSSGNARNLTIIVTIRDDGTYRIDSWKVAAVHNEEQPAGNLWTGN